MILDAPLTVTCSEGWIGFGDSCFKFVQESLSWMEAEAKCKEFGGDSHLASCLTEKELFFLAFQQKANPDAYFVGISRE